MSNFVGVRGVSLPSEGDTGIRPASFRVIGVQMRASRQYSDVIPVQSPDIIPSALGNYISAYNGRYCLENAVKNLNGQPGEFRVQAYQPDDAVQASLTLQDTQGVPADTLTISAAWRGLDDKSADGNSTGFTLTRGYRTTTRATEAAIATAVVLKVEGAADFRINDLIYINSATPEYRKIALINQATREITLSSGLSGPVAIGNEISAMGFRIATYRKDPLTGTEEPQNLGLDGAWLSMEPIGDDLYVGTAFRYHPWIKLSDDASAGLLEERWPADVTAITYLESGEQGTAPTEQQWADALAAFDDQEIRWLCNVETDTAAYNRSGKEYVQGRDDKPLWFGAAPQYATVAEYQDYGRQLLIAQDVYGALFAGRRPVRDPAGQGADPQKLIPLNLAKAAQHCLAIEFTGFHSAPAGERYPLAGFIPQADNPNDRFRGPEIARVADAGINLVVQRDGLLVTDTGRSFSTLRSAKFYHWKIMENWFKFAIADSFRRPFVGAPLQIQDIDRYADEVRDFGRELELEGSWPPGTDPDGPFGHYIKDDGTQSTLADVWKVSAVGNTQAEIDAGNAFLTIRFRPPGLGELLEIRVGVSLARN